MKRLIGIIFTIALWSGAAHANRGYLAISVSSATATQVVQENASKRSFTIYNAGQQTIYCGFDVSVATTTGMPIISGVAYEAGGDNRTFVGPVYCKAAAGSSGVEVRYWWWNR